MSFKRPCPPHYNQTSSVYPTTPPNTHHNRTYLSPIMVSTTVVGGVISLCCFIVFMTSFCKRRRARRERERREREERRSRSSPEQERAGNEVSDADMYSRWMRYICSPVENWPLPFGLSSEGAVEATVSHPPYPDPPPRYEECVGPGAARLCLPMEAPPPYSLIDSCPVLSGFFRARGGDNAGRSALGTVAVRDSPPPYEAVCGTGPSPRLHPLTEIELVPRGTQGSAIPKGDPLPSAEMEL